MLKIVKKKISLNICYLRSIVNKIWAHEILNYCSFHFIQIIKKKTLKKHSYISGIWVVKQYILYSKSKQHDYIKC